MSEAAAVLLDRSLRLSEHETALEVGCLLADLHGLASTSIALGAALRLRTGRVGASVRSQCEVGIAAAGAGGGVAGSDPAPGARGQDTGAGSDKFSGACGTPKPGGLPADGPRLRRTPLRYA